MDIVDRLRRYAGGMCVSTPPEMEAADEIERLRKELEYAQLAADAEARRGDALKAELNSLKATPQSVPDGWQLVPVEPTEAMLSAGWGGICHQKYVRKGMTINEYRFDKIGWSNMLKAAPKPGEGKC